MNRSNIHTPVYLVREQALRRNLDLIADVQRRAGVKIIMAFKANALWRTFDIFREYGVGCTASSPNELKLGLEFLTDAVHSYTPAYTRDTIGQFLAGSSHITFNSLGQWQQFAADVAAWNAAHPARRVSPGLRVNPRCSVVETDIYNPSLPGSRFGEQAEALLSGLPDGLEGLHFHALCEGSADDLRRVLEAFEEQFGHLLRSGCVRWVNMGGGHLMTREGYDVDGLVEILRAFRERYPGVEVILEPGSAFTWRTGDLLTSVVDVVENDGVHTAIIDASFACHMPDTLEMPYKPAITEAEANGAFAYRLGGNSCLSGDFMGDWCFAEPLRPGDRLTLEDMNHYTTVKTTMFNGIQHPDIALERTDGSIEMLRRFTYDDYRNRMD